MRGFTSPLWPIRYKPFPDELLSCWLVRLAHGHGLKVQTFCNLMFGNRRQIWNRDIDRLAPAWLIDELILRTGTSPETAWGTTLRAYEGILYPKFRLSSTLRWILALKVYHRTRQGYGLQFCPTCLAEDEIPYFRKRWRIALNTVCSTHGTMLFDRCPHCDAAVAFHRLDMAGMEAIDVAPLSYCHSCQFDLRSASPEKPIAHDAATSLLLLDASHQFSYNKTPKSDWDLGRFAVMHQLCRIMTTRYKHAHLREFVLDQVGVPDIELTGGHIPLEMRTIQERHHLMQLVGWLMVDLEPRLTAAWRAKAVRYNLLLKDFDDPSVHYKLIAEKLSNWRDRLGT
ncbi:TniQ family protein [Undibacterium rugosum]|uniref:TniQ family protein n=1 Tax=Undibacterium rugosum TaxID=2762291 RepID=UPI001B83EF83|nr:TniQ family protein [Undibacterium rugosum]MBR7777947.1 TniQ family protein [Undibacterium rugosum]